MRPIGIPQKNPYSAALYMKAAKDAGFHPFLGPSSNASQPYSREFHPDQLGKCGCGGYQQQGHRAAQVREIIIIPAGRVDLTSSSLLIAPT
jgi:hypothetical protein